MFAFVRVDSRLVHGQVIEAWLPSLKVSRVVVADGEAAASPLARSAMGLAIDPATEVRVARIEELDFEALAADDVPTLLLLRDVPGVAEAHRRGLPLPELNLGNVHASTGRKQVTRSVHLTEADLDTLLALEREGTRVEARAVPQESPVQLDELKSRFLALPEAR